jgi:hypothetical protein
MLLQPIRHLPTLACDPTCRNDNGYPAYEEEEEDFGALLRILDVINPLITHATTGFLGFPPVKTFRTIFCGHKGKTWTLMTEDDMRELEEADASEETSEDTLAATPVIKQIIDASEGTLAACQVTKQIKEKSEQSPDTQGVRSVLDKDGLPVRITKTAVKLLSAVQVRELAREIQVVNSEFESKYLQVTHSKSAKPRKEDWIDAIVAISRT